MYVGPASIKHLLSWFETANERIVLLFLAGGAEDRKFVGTLFDARDSVNLLAGSDIGVFLCLEPRKSSYAALHFSGNLHVLPFTSATSSAPQPQWDWQERLALVSAAEVDDSVRRQVERHTVQFTEQLMRHYGVDPRSLPALLMLVKDGQSRRSHFVFPLDRTFSVDKFFGLLRELRSTARLLSEDEGGWPGKGVRGKAYAKIGRTLTRQEMAALKYSERIRKVCSELSECVVGGSPECVEAFVGEAMASGEVTPDLATLIAKWPPRKGHEAGADYALAALKSILVKARTNSRHLKKSKAKLAALNKEMPSNNANIYDSINEILRRHALPAVAQDRRAPAGPMDVGPYVVAALAHVVSDEVATSYSGAVELAVVIALREEFSYFTELQPVNTRWEPDLQCYLHWFGLRNGRRGLVICLEGMGAERAALLAAPMALRFKPHVTISLGIAGAISDDVSVGDVVIGDQVDAFMVESKMIGKGEFRLSGDVYKSTRALVEHAINLAGAYPKHWSEVVRHSGADIALALSKADIDALVKAGIVRGTAFGVFAGHVATSPFVVASTEGVDWLKSRDRKYLAVEMEAAGVLAATHRSGVPGLVIRGVSDLADERKADLDRIGKGALRRYCMRNATRVVLSLGELGLLTS